VTAGAPLAPPPVKHPGTTTVIIAVVVGVALVLSVGAFVLRDRGSADASGSTVSSTTTAAAPLAPAETTTTLAAGPPGITFLDPAKVYSMRIGTDWTDGPIGFSGSPTWLAPVSSGTANVNPLVSRASGPDSLGQFAQSATTRLNAGSLYRVTASEPTTMADGTPATVLRYVSSQGAQLSGQALVTVSGLWGAVILQQCPPEGANTCFATLDPYVKSFHFLGQQP
jgi:hypothetical protein